MGWFGASEEEEDNPVCHIDRHELEIVTFVSGRRPDALRLEDQEEGELPTYLLTAKAR